MDEYIADYEYAQSISCVGESASVSARMGSRRLITSAYENIFIWNIDTLSVETRICYAAGSPVTAVHCFSEEEALVLVGHANGTVRCIDASGQEVFGFREHIKRVLGATGNREIAVVYTASAFSVIDARTESVVCTVEMELGISAVKVLGEAIFVGTPKGIFHRYATEEILNGVAEAVVVSLPGNNILDFLEGAGSVYAVLPESLVNVETKEEVKLQHRASFVSVCGDRLFTRDTKNKYRWLQLTGEGLQEKGVMKNRRPLASLQMFGDKAVTVFADNGIGVHRGSDHSTTVEGGRENLIALLETSQGIVGMSENEGKLFASVLGKDKLQALDISQVLFEETGMSCAAVHKDTLYIGKKDGTLCMRTADGGELHRIKVSSEAISSVEVLENVIAVGAGNTVVLLEGNYMAHERDEIEYEDAVLCVRMSPDGALIFASLADNTVKVHKVDGTKVLSLYGHSVPAVDMKACMEKGVLYTLGGDKLVKVWGLQHGECRKTLNPGDPSGMRLLGNLLVVSTGYGLIYYLKETFEKVKKVEYKTGKERAVPGERRIAVVDCHLAVIRERAVSLFLEGEFGTSPEEQRIREENQAETDEIAREKKIYRITVVEEMEAALEENDPHKICAALGKMTRDDIEKTVDIMNAEMQEKVLNALQEVPMLDQPLIRMWTLKHLLKRHPCSERIAASIEETRPVLRQHARMAMANRAGILWSLEE
ncbi:uncharacterized protein NEMAJ01_0228 [Nematocida major]|uniref:uncharacterized protein n=1 Tax=Nematocida major TaxID=1912982 RepID=UPI002008A0F2|nr:uncharacterized protein NEMAJ01_0228 [Nematocida major]KAH9385332.1 hypothetical protein NEMAJ01_0228 [Nematocida major]